MDRSEGRGGTQGGKRRYISRCDKELFNILDVKE